jgi:hypothetical protein
LTSSGLRGEAASLSLPRLFPGKHANKSIFTRLNEDGEVRIDESTFKVILEEVSNWASLSRPLNILRFIRATEFSHQRKSWGGRKK